MLVVDTQRIQQAEPARQMLEDSVTPVQSIASAVGYDNVTFFRQIFRRYTGVTPAEYRSNFKPIPSAGIEIEEEPMTMSIAV